MNEKIRKKAERHVALAAMATGPDQWGNLVFSSEHVEQAYLAGVRETAKLSAEICEITGDAMLAARAIRALLTEERKESEG